MTKQVHAIGVVSLLALSIFGTGHAAAAAPNGFWQTQVQVCAKSDPQGSCTKWANAGSPAMVSSDVSPKAKGSMCGGKTTCTIETVANQTRQDNVWMTVCPITGKVSPAR